MSKILHNPWINWFNIDFHLHFTTPDKLWAYKSISQRSAKEFLSEHSKSKHWSIKTKGSRVLLYYNFNISLYLENLLWSSGPWALLKRRLCGCFPYYTARLASQSALPSGKLYIESRQIFGVIMYFGTHSDKNLIIFPCWQTSLIIEGCKE